MNPLQYATVQMSTEHPVFALDDRLVSYNRQAIHQADEEFCCARIQLVFPEGWSLAPRSGGACPLALVVPGQSSRISCPVLELPCRGSHDHNIEHVLYRIAL